MKKNIFSLLLLTTSLSSMANNAVMEITAKGPFYIGGFIGQSSFDLDQVDLSSSSNIKLDDSDSAYKLIAGYSFNPHFSLEAGYANLGQVSAKVSEGFSDGYVSYQFSADASVEVSGLILNLVATLPLNEQFAAYAKLGMFSWDAKLHYKDHISETVNGQTYAYSDSDTESEDDNDTFYGLGLAYQWDNLSIRGEYEVYQSDSEDIDVVSLGITYHF